MLNDIRHALRLLTRHPGFTAVAVITLALGVGANTAIFTVVRKVLLRPLAFAGGDRVVFVWGRSTASRIYLTPSTAMFEAFRQAKSFDAIEAFTTSDEALTGGGDPEQVSTAQASPGLLAFVGAAPLVGRDLRVEDTRADATPVALIAEPLWKRRYAAKATLIGTTVALNDKPVTIVGVVPAPVRFPAGPKVDFVVPLAQKSGLDGTANVSVIAKLRPEVTTAQAEAELTGLVKALPPQAVEHDWSAALMRPRDRIGTTLVRSLVVLFAAVGCLLLIACVNVTNLVLARNTAREREIAVRRALGAGRPRLLRQLLVESLVLAIAGGVASVIVAMWTLALISALRPAWLPELEGLSLSPAVLGFNLLVAAGCGLLFGALPAFRAVRTDLHSVLRGSSQGLVRAGGREWLRRGLLVAEIALALVLMTGAGLLARSFVRLQQVPLGFVSERIVAVELRLPVSRYPKPELGTAFFAGLLERTRGLSGVERATLATGIPPHTGIMFGDLWIDGQLLPKGQQPDLMASNFVDGQFFETFRMRLLEGRTFGSADGAGGERTMIVNAATARRFWPGRSAIGGRLGVGRAGHVSWATVVGVVNDIKANGIADDTGDLQIYAPFAQQPYRLGTLLVRAGGDPMALVPALKAAVWAGDDKLSIRDITLASSRVADALSPQRFNLVVFGMFAALGVALAVVGVYGVMMYFAAQREHEMGVRLALGATARDVMRLVIGQSAAVTGGGLALGLVCSWLLSRYLTTLLYEIRPTDPMTFVATTALLAIAALAGTGIPAWRVTRVNPTRALRGE
jgi:putative ABC transport system permease protein